MKEIWIFFKVHLLSDLRNRRAVFWALIFPVLLLSILVLTFTNLGLKGSLKFKVIIINESHSTAAGVNYANSLIDAFKSVSYPNRNAFFALTFMKPDDVNTAIQEVEYSRADIVIIIPKTFNSDVMRSILLSKMGIPVASAKIKVFYLPNEASSSLAQGAVQGVMDEINSYVISKLRYKLKTFTIHSETIGEIMESPSYTDFVSPGIIVVGAFTSGLLLIAPKLASMRRYGIMKKYASTPAKPQFFFFGFTMSKIFMMLIQYFLLAFLAIYVFNSNIHIFSLKAILYYLFICVTYALMGFDIGFLVSGPTAVGALTSSINLPLEFLAGIYFPLFNLPWYVNIFVYANPLWYSTNALRQLLGVGLSTTPMWMNIFVPSLWMLGSLTFLSTRKMWKRI